jgi:phosphinothricin acetyltransferase
VKPRLATADDAAAIASIYAPYVMATAVSFETTAPDAAEMARRIEAGAADYPWLVGCGEDGAILGYAYASAFRPRPAYRFTVETSAYVADGTHGRGIGRSLYTLLLALLKAQGFAQAIAAITLPNEASVALHEKLGFVRIGTYERVGFKFGEWRSVGLWQCPLAKLSAHPKEPKPVSAVWEALAPN